MRKYVLNPETLMYEIKEVSLKHKVFKGLLLLAGSMALAFLYAWILTSVLGVDLPKTAFLKAEKARWESRMVVMNRQLDKYDEALTALQVRDDEVYRSIFGMDEISPEVRNAGAGGVDKYSYLDGLEPDNRLKNTLSRLDRISRKTYVQSKSFDEVAALASTAGDMASCIPAVPPIIPDPRKYTVTSPFGVRNDPFTNEGKMHTGVDFSMKIGNPVYSTGDGTVETVEFDFFGYGNSVTIDHGFGFKTRYAHLSTVSVREGMKVRRGDCVGEVGKSGRATGPHLHYEVEYMGNKVNPAQYYDLSMSKDEYIAMVNQRASESQAILTGTPRQTFSFRQRKHD